MKICVAQTKPVKGNISTNIVNHKKLIDLAIDRRADMIFFPELSITGYEPALAKELATTRDDKRFDEFQVISDTHNLTIGIGMPLIADEPRQAGIRIGMIIFQPRAARQAYCKQHLHADEYPYFVNGNDQIYLAGNGHKLGLSICYEMSIPEHSAKLHQEGATIYISSVAKTAEGMKKAAETLPAMALDYSMAVLLSNCVGRCDNFDAVGRSAVWSSRGVLLGQLDDAREGILVYDTTTGELVH